MLLPMLFDPLNDALDADREIVRSASSGASSRVEALLATSQLFIPDITIDKP